MDILFASARLRKNCTREREAVKAWGAEQARRLLRRLDQLRAAENLEQMRTLPGRCHELKGNLAGVLSIDLKHPYRLLFEPATEEVPEKPDGGLDWTRVTSISVLKVEDTHG